MAASEVPTFANQANAEVDNGISSIGSTWGVFTGIEPEVEEIEVFEKLVARYSKGC